MIHDPWYRSLSLLPQRLVGFSDGPSEAFNPQEGGEGQAGVSEEAAERAAEERRQSAQAAKKQRKEEKKAKKREDQLADIIRAYIQGARRDDKMALLLSRLLQRNTPPSILLAVMSLTNKDVLEVLENYLEDEQDIIPDDRPPESGAEVESQALVQYGKELSLALSEWTKRIFLHASFHPMKSILSLAHHHGVDNNMIQLTTFTIRNFFQDSGQDIPYDNIRDFSELFWRDALKRLHQLADDRGLLPDPNRDLDDDDDDDDDDD